MTEAPEPVDAFSLLKGRADDTAHLKRLRFAVIGMGVLLAVGFATVIGRIFYLMTRQPSPSTASDAGSMLASGDVAATLPVGAHAVQHALSGSQVSVLYDGPDGQGIVIFDLKSGREVGHVRLKTGAR